VIGSSVSKYKRCSLSQANGYIESFNGKLREELLAREWFDTLLEDPPALAWTGTNNGARS